jgi:hypothetical protein
VLLTSALRPPSPRPRPASLPQPSPSGIEYEPLAVGLKTALTKDPSAFDADRLMRINPETVQAWVSPHVLPNIEERVAKLREVGAVLNAEFGGCALNLVKAARNSAGRLVRLVTTHFPGFRDEAVYRGRQVFFYKRAQIFAADVWGAYGCRMDEGDASCPGAFPDIGALTMFADYRLPQILRSLGVLRYSQALASTVDLQGEVGAGSADEVELRACTVAAVEQLRTLLNRKLMGRSLSEVSGSGPVLVATGSVPASPAGGAGGVLLGASTSRGLASPLLASITAPPAASPSSFSLSTAGSDPGAAAAPAIRASPVTSVELDWFLWGEGEKRKDKLLPHHRTNTMFY